MKCPVLVVEACPFASAVYRESLESSGYEATLSTDPIQALKIFRSAPVKFSMILTEIELNPVSGLWLVQQIRRLDSSLRVFLMTEDESLRQKAEALRPELQFTAVFQKSRLFLKGNWRSRIVREE